MDVITNRYSSQLLSDTGVSQHFDTLSDNSSDELANYSDPGCSLSSMSASYRQRTYTMPTSECDRLEVDAKRRNIDRGEETRKKFKCEYDSDDIYAQRTCPAARTHQPIEGDEKRQIRRERNKQAAARCRQRRVDLTNSLTAEAESLQQQKNELELEISKLQRQRNELQCVLESHSSQCHMLSTGVNVLRTRTAVQRNDHPFASILTEQVTDDKALVYFKTVPIMSSHVNQQRPVQLPVTAFNQLSDFPINSSTGVDQCFADVPASTWRHCGSSSDIVPTYELLSPTTLLAL